MVYFNCAGCGNGFKKNQVEQHMYTCKSRVFSCIDCNKDFKNDEYKFHVKCITESEKYESKSSYVSKANKGELKQNAWLEKVTQAVQTFKGSQKARSLLEKLIDYPNIPRKKAKFFNFSYNSFRSYNVTDTMLEEIWSVIESFDKKTATTQVVVPPASTIQPSVQKRKLEEIIHEEEQEEEKRIKPEHIPNQDETTKFDWLELIKNELNKKENHQMSLSKLSKKIFKKHKKLNQITNDDKKNEDDDQQKAQFDKKLIKKLKKNVNIFKLVDSLNNNYDNKNGNSSDFESIFVKLNEIN